MPVPEPPRSQNGEVVPHDHPDIGNDDGIVRRISDQWVTSGQNGPRLSSMALKTSSGPDGGMSVDLERYIVEAGIEPMAYVTSPKHIASIRFEAGMLRAENLMVGVDPIPPDQSFHGEVWGEIPKGKFKRLMRKAAWFVQLPGVNLSDV